MRHTSETLLIEYQALSSAERIAAAKAIAANMELSPVEVYGALESITRPPEVKCLSLPPSTLSTTKQVESGKKQQTLSITQELSQRMGGR